MFKYNYKLNLDNYIDLNYYLAIHDIKIQQKVVPLINSITTLLVIVEALIMGISMSLLFVAIVTFIIVFVLFPKIYWKIIFNRVKSTIDQKKVNFKETNIIFNEKISIKSDGNIIEIEYIDIKKIDFTKANCLLFYTNQNKTNSIIIPNSTIGDELEKFYEFMMKEITKNGKK